VFSAEDGFVEAAGEVVPVSAIFGEQFSQAKVVIGQLRVVGARAGTWRTGTGTLCMSTAGLVNFPAMAAAGAATRTTSATDKQILTVMCSPFAVAELS
jgi:hypothetical protein